MSARPCDSAEAMAWLLGVLAHEPQDVQDNVDGKQFGRPLSLEGIEGWFGPLETHGGRYDPAASFVTEYNGAPAAHCCVRIGTVYLFNPDATVGVLGIVYTAPELRGRGLASAAVRMATSHAFQHWQDIEAVLILVADRNESAQRFYSRLGFAPTDMTIVKGDVAMTVWMCKRGTASS